MKIETLSTFPHMYDSVMNSSMMRIAQEKGVLEFQAHDLRDWTKDRHRTTDDEPYGGGQGLVMKCEPIFDAYADLCSSSRESSKPYTIFMSPAGEQFSEALACELSEQETLLFVCGHYEGFDDRVYTLADKVVSIGDYVLTSGELASMVVIDAVVRKINGVLGDAQSAKDDSFHDGLLEYPHYTRPADFRGLKVPDILLSGDHAAIARWRQEQSLIRTKDRRPDLLEKVILSSSDCEFLNSLSSARRESDEALS